MRQSPYTGYLPVKAKPVMISNPTLSTRLLVRSNTVILAGCALMAAVAAPIRAQDAAVPADTTTNPSIKAMIGRLDLEKYKATIKGLTQFGDRRQGTDRNRAAVDWIEAQLKS